MSLTKAGSSKKVSGITNPAILAKLAEAGWAEGEAEPVVLKVEVPKQSAEPEPPAGNASREAWADYAKHLGIEVAEEATRNEIRANVEQLLGDDED